MSLSCPVCGTGYKTCPVYGVTVKNCECEEESLMPKEHYAIDRTPLDPNINIAEGLISATGCRSIMDALKGLNDD